MKKFFDFLFSMQMMGILIMLFAMSIATATFIENDYGTQAAHIMVYRAHWFEILLFLVALNLVANIFRKKLYMCKRWPIFLFHASFIIILAGAAITRYWGYEATMHIREGESSNHIFTTNSFINIRSNNGIYQEQVKHNFNPYSNTGYKTNLNTQDQNISIELLHYIPHAETSIEKDNSGTPVIELVVADKGRMSNMQSYILENNKSKNINNQLFEFNTNISDKSVKFSYSDSLRIYSPNPIKSISMVERTEKLMAPHIYHIIKPGKLYEINGNKIVVKTFLPKAKLKYAGGNNPNNPDMLIFGISQNNQQHQLIVTGKADEPATYFSCDIEGTSIAISYGTNSIKLPFSIHLNDFKLERYPGSTSPSSFSSDITLFDNKKDFKKEYNIYMNNILKYEGFRFYQSSYDKDEKGTILTVSHDLWGTTITYSGYFVMVIGMILSLFVSTGRFRKLSHKTRSLNKATSRGVVTLILLISSLSLSAQNQSSTPDEVPLKQATKFGQILVQDNGGRIKPLNSLTSEVVRKITRHNRFRGLSSDQIFLSMLTNPNEWQMVPLIKVSNPVLAKKIGIRGKYASFLDFISQRGIYKLGADVQIAHSQKPSLRSPYQKEIITVDERVNICYMVFTGEFLKIFPHPGNENHKWYKYTDTYPKPSKDSLFIKNVIPLYIQSIKGKDFVKAEELVYGIKKYQEKNGGDIIPSPLRQRVEILYNNINIFKRLFPFYLITGFLLLFILIWHVIRPSIKMGVVIHIAWILLVTGFGLHTMGLVTRWYIAGHAPWSNGYESMTYVAWACLLAGFLFARKSTFTLAATSLLSGLTLFVAHLSWMSPEVTNLVPVLKSYWLTLHVAIITASYGFLALAAILGLINLILIILSQKENQQRSTHTISHLSTIGEMALIAGLYMLTIGTILGAIWANEAWGRYWGWDPKETWALVTILVYGFVIHMRSFGSIYSLYSFNLASLLAFSCVLMTYFGVNYYLAGLHSYAKGDPIPIPSWVYYSVASIMAIAITAYYRYNILSFKFLSSTPDEGN